jgi:hypothetical protein
VKGWQRSSFPLYFFISKTKMQGFILGGRIQIAIKHIDLEIRI